MNSSLLGENPGIYKEDKKNSYTEYLRYHIISVIIIFKISLDSNSDMVGNMCTSRCFLERIFLNDVET